MAIGYTIIDVYCIISNCYKLELFTNSHQQMLHYQESLVIINVLEIVVLIKSTLGSRNIGGDNQGFLQIFPSTNPGSMATRLLF